jgi:putative glycosyltransferase (TIGR04372 family)
LYSGHFNEWEKYEEIIFYKREQLLNQLLPLQLGIRIFSIHSVRGIGFMCHWDGLIKARHLGLIPPDKFVMLWNKEKFSANKHWMSYLEKQVILLDEKKQNKKLIGFLKKTEHKVSEHVSGPFRLGNRVYVNNLSALALIEHHWSEGNRRPLFNLTTEDIEFGRTLLSGLGVPKEAWFVCLHVREGGFKASEPHREAPIKDYLMAIKAVVDRGGWVIRMGDRTMAQLPKIKNVIDYPYSAIYSDRMDIILCGLCRFFVGTSSGLYTVAKAFGKPIVQTNYLPASTLYLSDPDIFLPKLAKRAKDGKLLGFSEIMSAPFSQCVIDINYKQLGVDLINNTPEEIQEIVVEMIDKIDGQFKSDSTDELLQLRFKEMTAEVGTLFGLDNFPINCRIGARFLDRHQELLFPSKQYEKQAI